MKSYGFYFKESSIFLVSIIFYIWSIKCKKLSTENTTRVSYRILSWGGGGGGEQDGSRMIVAHE